MDIAVRGFKRRRMPAGEFVEFGLRFTHVLGRRSHVEYSYTTGLYKTYGYPELIILGLPSALAREVLSAAVYEINRGAPIELSAPSDALLQGYFCNFAVVPVSSYSRYVGFARWCYQGDDFPLCQIVWPSRSGLFPWHPEAEPAFRKQQPVIARPSGGGRTRSTTG